MSVCTIQALDCQHAECRFSASTRRTVQTHTSIFHKALHHSRQTTKDERYSRVSKTISLRLARQRKRFKAGAFKESASEKNYDNYQEPDAIELDYEIAHRITYAIKSGDGDKATRKALSQLCLHVCEF